MKKAKLLAIVVAVMALLFVIPTVASADQYDGWHKVADGHYEYYDYGSKVMDCEYYIDGSYFRFDENGKMYNAKWYQNPYTSDWYYYQSGGYRADSTIIKIGNSYYGFNDEGIMYDNCEFDFYADSIGRYAYFYANAGGVLKTNQWVWFEEWESWKYYTANGAAANGLTFVGNTPYLFWGDGELVNEQCLYDHNYDRSYYADKNGVATALNVSGWTKIGNDWFYCENKQYVSSEIKKVGNVYYAFDYSGKMLDDETEHIYNNELDSYGWVRAKKGGTLYRNEWYKDTYGNWYYYTDSFFAASGLKYIGSTPYLFYGDGQLMENNCVYDDNTGTSYYADENGVVKKLAANGWTQIGEDYVYCVDGMLVENEVRLIGGKYYYFNYNGFMLKDETFNIFIGENEVIGRAKASGALCCGEWYMCEDGNFEYYGHDFNRFWNGFLTVNGKVYYFEEGYAVKNRIVESDSSVYLATADCSLKICPTGWVNVGDDFYYVYNDQLVRNNIKQIDSKKYVFDYSGRMYSDGVYDIEVYDSEYDYYVWNYYLVNKDGSVVEKQGWNAFDGNWYYVNADASLYNGELKLNGQTYYLWPAMQYATIDYQYDYDGDTDGHLLYAVAPDGKYQKITTDGYYNTPYGRVLVEGGKLFEGWKNVNGTYYYFSPSMAVDEFRYIDENTYYFDITGKMHANGWLKFDSSYIYANAYGIVSDGLSWIGGKYYLFEENRLLYNGYLYENGNIYVSDSNGVATKLSNGNGWKNVNGYYYYVHYGNLASGTTYIQEGNTENCYFFDYTTHRMMSDYFNGSYYFDAYGRRYEGWKMENGSWVYYSPYKCSYGLYYIDDARYCFNDCKLVTNTTYFDSDYDMIFVIDAYGKVADSYDVPDGIIYQDGAAYKFVNGKPYEGWYGDYFFNEYGRMCINEIIEYNGEHYYLDKHGKYIRNGWYQRYENTWYYANSSGALYYNEWLQLGNAWYYFNGARMLSNGICYIEAEEKYGNFDKYGKFLGYVDTDKSDSSSSQMGWKQINGAWYYYNSTGSLVYECSLYINNVWYCFGDDGKMLTNSFNYDYYYGGLYYYTASGARLEIANQWKLINGNWCYFDAMGSVALGWININGTSYFIDSEEEYNESADNWTITPKMLTGYQLIDGEVYKFASSGALVGEYTSNGWLQLADGDFVYFKNGAMLKDGIYTINGVKYYFYYSGRLLTDDWTYVEDEDMYVYAGSTGALYGVGWHKVSEGWIYVDAYGELLTDGVYKLGNSIYYFANGIWVP